MVSPPAACALVLGVQETPFVFLFLEKNKDCFKDRSSVVEDGGMEEFIFLNPLINLYLININKQ